MVAEEGLEPPCRDASTPVVNAGAIYSRLVLLGHSLVSGAGLEPAMFTAWVANFKSAASRQIPPTGHLVCRLDVLSLLIASPRTHVDFPNQFLLRRTIS